MGVGVFGFRFSGPYGGGGGGGEERAEGRGRLSALLLLVNGIFFAFSRGQEWGLEEGRLMVCRVLTAVLLGEGLEPKILNPKPRTLNPKP